MVFYNVKQIIPLGSSSLCKYFSKGTVLEPRVPTWSTAKPYPVPSLLNHQPPGSSKLCWAAPPRSFPPPAPAIPPLRFSPRRTRPSAGSAHLRDPPQGPPCPDPAFQGSGPPSTSAPSSASTHSRPGSPPFRKTVRGGRRLADSPAIIAREPPGALLRDPRGPAARRTAASRAPPPRALAPAPPAPPTPRARSSCATPPPLPAPSLAVAPAPSGCSRASARAAPPPPSGRPIAARSQPPSPASIPAPRPRLRTPPMGRRARERAWRLPSSGWVGRGRTAGGGDPGAAGAGPGGGVYAGWGFSGYKGSGRRAPRSVVPVCAPFPVAAAVAFLAAARAPSLVCGVAGTQDHVALTLGGDAPAHGKCL